MHLLEHLTIQKTLAVAALSIILVLGAVLRVHDVERRTLNHPEVYSPGIDLPWNLSNPNPRFTLWQTLAGTIAGEPHPPGYYIVMLAWTKLFGSSIFSLRLPSLLFGVASIFLIYVLAIHTENTLTGILAAAMLAGNGLHLYWSQTARMYSMGCFLALLSTVLLVLMVKHTARQRTYCVLYFVFTLAGLATHVYFWAVFATQALWVFARNVRQFSSPPNLLRLQLRLCIMATPLLAIAAYQSGAATRPTTLVPLDGAIRFFQLGSLFESDPLASLTGFLNGLIEGLAFLATAVLFPSAVFNKNHQSTSREIEKDAEPSKAPSVIVTAAIALSMALTIFGFARLAGTFLPARSTRLVIATSMLPVALCLLDFLIASCWKWLEGLRQVSAKQMMLPESFRSLNLFLAVLPLTIIATVSLFNPIFVERGTIIFAPFLLIVLSSGLATLIERDKRWISLGLILVVIHFCSIVYYQSKPSDPDYKGLAERWGSEIKDSDLIFVHGRGHRADWRVAPIFYYLNARRYHFVGDDFASEIHNHPDSRVWVLSFPSIPTEQEAVDALASYKVRKRVDAQSIFAELYVSKAPAGSQPLRVSRVRGNGIETQLQ
jgi:4-amino-4-deoxy-L-arabinose transferase-like glycosyltransferase